MFGTCCQPITAGPAEKGPAPLLRVFAKTRENKITLTEYYRGEVSRAVTQEVHARAGFFSSKEVLRRDTPNVNTNSESKDKEPGLLISGFSDGLYIPGPGSTTRDCRCLCWAGASPKSQAGASREHCSTAGDSNSLWSKNKIKGLL